MKDARPPGVPTWTSVIDGVSEQQELRRDATEFLSGRGVSQPVIHDAMLVISELTTNAFVHGLTDSVTVDVAVAPESVAVATSHRDVHGAAPASIPHQMAGPDQLTGRGLAIVDAVAASVDRRTTADGCRRTSTLIDRRAATPHWV